MLAFSDEETAALRDELAKAQEALSKIGDIAAGSNRYELVDSRDDRILRIRKLADLAKGGR
jgi:hypothetical protein